ncbi:MBL fold metallo-hydrolase [Neobacillus sp. MM2021_6]|uniref:MBL fold metallo-hydrolase n=1 Tax=Bacillaceae TaxID=186817 RepID=UPI00140D0BE7|nr:MULTISPECIES: MBL fold metallo-hydrolase [Bacillaceae]MBO0959511.1 MBL fold metallo-hydrolase [Neobacillus sp. MM2021_6]NHC17191.1 MBL fold metallo-hydrolase [Bacillus sp. MM2020_4]
MKWQQIPLGALQTNCYLVENSDRTCLIFDPGGEGNKLIHLLQERKLKPVAIILTHAHFDHIGAVNVVREAYKIPVYVHKQEEKWLGDPALNGSQMFMHVEPIRVNPADHIIKNEGTMKIGDFEFDVSHTPGHSPGSVSFYFEKDGFVISGDALFQGSIGRTDLPGGNNAQLLKSIHDKLLTLPEETYVLSGHGAVTTIGEEMDSNPFLNGF